ncbi:MAG: FtsX-like permease family protein [Cyanobacteria bacterium P01_H01_bin.74]
MVKHYFLPLKAGFRKIVVRALWHNKLRTSLTVLGVALGVAILLAINLANDMAFSNFKNSIEKVGGTSTLSIQPYQRDTLPESLLSHLRWLWRLPVDTVNNAENQSGKTRHYQASTLILPIIEQTALWYPHQNPEKTLENHKQNKLQLAKTVPALTEVIQVLGVDLFSQNPQNNSGMIVLEQSDDPAALLKDGAVFIGEGLAATYNLRVGNVFSLLINDTVKAFTVSGILSSTGLGSAYDGNLVLMDIGAAQKVFAMPGQLNRIDLRIPPDDVPWVKEKLQQSLNKLPGIAAEAVRPEQRSAQLDKMLRSYQYNLTTLSFIALLVGVFLIYNTMSISIIRRRPEIGTLRAIGLSKVQVFNLFLLEAFGLGLLGTLLGIVFGIVLSRFSSEAVATTVANLYTGQLLTHFSINPWLIVQSVAFGCIMTVLGAIVPLYESASVSPAEATRRFSYESKFSSQTVLLAVLGVLLLVLGGFFAAQPAVDGLPVFGFLAAVLVIFGAALLLPEMIQRLSHWVLPGLKKWLGTEVYQAGLMLRGSLARTAVAVASLMVGIAMMVSLAIMISSFRQTVNSWIEQTLKADLWIEPASKFGSKQTGRMRLETVKAIENVKGVAAVDPFFEFPLTLDGQPTNLGVGSFDVLAAYGNLKFLSGESPKAILARMKTHPAVTVTESFSTKFNKTQGDTIVLQTPAGQKSFVIEGVYTDYSSDLGYIVMPRFWYTQFYNDERINNLAVYVTNDETADAVRNRILDQINQSALLHIRSNKELRTEVLRIFDKTFAITYALHAIAIVVALLTIMNALFALVLEAKREFGILKYLGASAKQIQAIVLSIAAMLGILGNVSGLTVGLVLSQLLIKVINKQSFGWTIGFDLPVMFLVQATGLVLVTALVSGLIPARLAAKTLAPEVIKSE